MPGTDRNDAVSASRVRELARAIPGARRLYAAYRAHVRPAIWRDWIVTHVRPGVRPVETPFGFVLYAPRFLANLEMQEGTFEPGELACVQALLRSSDRLVDVGANIGWYTCLARHAGRPALAIEPQRRNLDCLYRTLEENGWLDTEVLPIGLGAAPGIAFLYGASGPGASLIRDWAGYSSRTRQAIPLGTLDAVLGGRFAHERLLIKIDVEGAEFDVLRGASMTLARQPRPAWVVEICLHQYHPTGNRHFLETFERFWSSGYQARRIDASLSPVTRRDVERWVHAGRTEASTINYVFSGKEG